MILLKSGWSSRPAAGSCPPVRHYAGLEGVIKPAWNLPLPKTNRCRSYEVLVGVAAEAVGLSSDLADRLVERYSKLAPWPEVAEVLCSLQGCLPLGVVTNCSKVLGQLAAARTGINFETIVTAGTGQLITSRISVPTSSLSGELNVQPAAVRSIVRSGTRSRSGL